MILPITLTAAGCAALINLWLGIRIGQMRTKEKISIGDGGNDNLIRRMRAQSNFIEFTPIVLVLLGLVESASGTSTWLWVVAALYLIGRILHPLGMDADGFGKGRMIGTLTSMLTTLGLGIYAIVLAFTAHPEVTAPMADDPAVSEVPEG